MRFNFLRMVRKGEDLWTHETYITRSVQTRGRGGGAGWGFGGTLTVFATIKSFYYTIRVVRTPLSQSSICREGITQ